MSVIDTMRTIAGEMTDANSDPLSVEFFYGPEGWKLIDTHTLDSIFIYVDPISGSIPEKPTGHLREDYNIQLLFGQVLSDPDPSKEDQESKIWEMRPYCLQYIRRLFEETDANGTKLFMPMTGAEISEVRAFMASNIYGVIATFTLRERTPSETC